MSNGRVELGLGAGWYDAEHTAYGIPFPPLGERFERLEEQLAIITGLWSTPVGRPVLLRRAHYQLADSPALPKPVQQPGPSDHRGRRGPETDPAAGRAVRRRVQRPLPLHRRHGPAIRRGAGCLHGGRSRPGHADHCRRRRSSAVAATRRRSLAGRAPSAARWTSCGRTACADDPTRCCPGSSDFATAGAQRVYLQMLDLTDLEHLELIAEDVLPVCASY